MHPVAEDEIFFSLFFFNLDTVLKKIEPGLINAIKF